VVARSYVGVSSQEAVKIDGWTYNPDFLRGGDRVLLVDDVYDSGRTINHLVGVIMERGLSRQQIKIAVHDYKIREYLPDNQPFKPDYWCRKIEILKPEDETWIHYMSHELVGLTPDEAQRHYISVDPELAEPMRLVTDMPGAK